MTVARPFVLFLAVLSLSGCVGVVVFRTRAGEFDLGDGEDDRGQVSTSLTTGAPPSASALERTWGKPDRIRREDADTELWTYRNGLRWNGVIPVVFLPLPLIAPVGWDRVTFRIQGGRVVWATEAVQEEINYVCGVIPRVCPSFGCATWREDAWSAFPRCWIPQRLNARGRDRATAPPAHRAADGDRNDVVNQGDVQAGAAPSGRADRPR